MAKKLFTTSYLSDIANSIRNKLGVANNFKISEMASAIDSIIIKEQPQLFAPHIYISGDILNIVKDDDNGAFNDNATFEVLVDNYKVYDIGTQTSVNLLELTGLTAGLHLVKVIEKQTNFANSEYSNVETWERNVNGLRLTAYDGNVQIKLLVEKDYAGATLSSTPNIYYKKSNSGTWTQWFNSNTGQSDEITIEVNTNILICNLTDSLGSTPSAYLRFAINSSSAGKIIASGNLMSMLNNREELHDYAFYGLFRYCSKLTSLHNGAYGDETYLTLPRTKLAPYCYYGLFAESGTFEMINELPATEMEESCYSFMYHKCSSLVIDSNKQNALQHITTLAKSCFVNMFSYCSNLSRVVHLPNVNQLAVECYMNMYEQTNLTDIADMSMITTLAKSCFSGMYKDCNNIVDLSEKVLIGGDIPELAYYAMFAGCMTLTKTPTIPNLTSVGKNAMAFMFQNCFELKVGTQQVSNSYTRICQLPNSLGDGAVHYMFEHCQEYHTTGWEDGTPLAGQEIFYQIE